MTEQQPPNVAYDYRVSMPATELHYNMMLTESAWGSPDMNPAVQNELMEAEENVELRNATNEQIIKRGWDLFSIYTRDMRISNLDDNDLTYVDYHLDLAFQLLQNNFKNSFAVALGYSATVLETRQSKKGFLRKRMNTLTTENINRDLEPPRKKIFSKGGGE